MIEHLYMPGALGCSQENPPLFANGNGIWLTCLPVCTVHVRASCVKHLGSSHTLLRFIQQNLATLALLLLRLLTNHHIYVKINLLVFTCTPYEHVLQNFSTLHIMCMLQDFPPYAWCAYGSLPADFHLKHTMHQWYTTKSCVGETISYYIRLHVHTYMYICTYIRTLFDQWHILCSHRVTRATCCHYSVWWDVVYMNS